MRERESEIMIFKKGTNVSPQVGLKRNNSRPEEVYTNSSDGLFIWEYIRTVGI